MKNTPKFFKSLYSNGLLPIVVFFLNPQKMFRHFYTSIRFYTIHMKIYNWILIYLAFSLFQLNAASPMAKREQMRLNFGAGHPVFRLNVSHFGEMYPGGPNSPYGRAGNTEAGMMTRLIVNAEAMVMINNREDLKTDEYSDKKGHFEKRPMFVNLQASYDYFNLSNTFSASLANSTTCNMGLGLLGYMRGYWAIGISSRSNHSAVSCVENIGTQLALNLYNSKNAIAFKLSYYPKAESIYSEKSKNYNTNSKIVLNALMHSRISDRVLYGVGIENNCPKVGLSYLGGNWRLGVDMRVFQKQTQYGFTLNHSF